MQEIPSIDLNGCYHDGVAYSLGYEAGGKIELTGKTFTMLRGGFEGGAEAALLEHRKNFDIHKDIPRFIVALNPCQIISGRMSDNTENYGLPPECDEECYGSCSLDDCCDTCYEDVDDCECFDDDVCCDDCDELEEDCECRCYRYEDCDVDDLDEEFVCDSFSQMNPFDRARWNKAKNK